MSTKPMISLVIPCYREEGHLLASYERIVEILELSRYPFEIIFVDDVSPDRTRDVIQRIVAKDPRTRAIYHEKNKGRGGAVTTGVHVSRGPIVGFIDIDLEVDAVYIPMLALEIERGADVAYGYRYYNLRTDTAFRWFSTKGYLRASAIILGQPRRDTESGYKFFRREKILPILAQCENQRWFWDTEVVTRAAKAGLIVTSRPVLFRRRPEKASTVDFFRDVPEQILELWRFRQKLKTMPTIPTHQPQPLPPDQPEIITVELPASNGNGKTGKFAPPS